MKLLREICINALLGAFLGVTVGLPTLTYASGVDLVLLLRNEPLAVSLPIMAGVLGGAVIFTAVKAIIRRQHR